MRCTNCASPAVVIDDRVRIPHLTWCPRWRAPLPPDGVLLAPTPYAEPLTDAELDELEAAEAVGEGGVEVAIGGLLTLAVRPSPTRGQQRCVTRNETAAGGDA